MQSDPSSQSDVCEPGPPSSQTPGVPPLTRPLHESVQSPGGYDGGSGGGVGGGGFDGRGGGDGTESYARGRAVRSTVGGELSFRLVPLSLESVRAKASLAVVFTVVRLCSTARPASRASTVLRSGATAGALLACAHQYSAREHTPHTHRTHTRTSESTPREHSCIGWLDGRDVWTWARCARMRSYMRREGSGSV